MSVDIIVPNFNKGKYLKKAINSVLKQSYKNWKLYIIDDCSNDESRDILKKFYRNKKIKIFYLNKRKGPGYCRNLGIIKSKSKFISFLDSDDFWKKNKLKNQMKIMTKDNLAIVYSDYFTFFEKDNNQSKYLISNVPNNFNFNKFIYNSSINTSTLIIKRNLLKNVKFRNLLLHEDYIFKCEIFRKNKNLEAFKTKNKDVFYRIAKKSRSSGKLKSFYYLWKYNKIFNNLSFFKNFLSIISISLNSLKKYGLQK